MALISNVTNGATISTTWGNAIRDGVLQTSTTAAGFPSSPAVGTQVLMTDTGRIWVYVGGSTQVGSNPAGWIPNGQVSASGRTGCALRRVNYQTVTNASYQQILFDTEDFDSDAFITASTGSPAGTITIPTGLDGLYAITAQIWTGSAAGQDAVIQHFTTVGGLAYAYSYAFGPVPRSAGWPSAPNQGYPFGNSITIRMKAADTLKVLYYQSSGASQNTAAFFSLDKVGL